MSLHCVWLTRPLGSAFGRDVLEYRVGHCQRKTRITWRDGERFCPLFGLNQRTTRCSIVKRASGRVLRVEIGSSIKNILKADALPPLFEGRGLNLLSSCFYPVRGYCSARLRYHSILNFDPSL